MRPFLFFALLILFSPLLRSQIPYIGKWKINQLIGLPTENEYTLSHEDELHIYGNRLELRPDSTFTSAYSARCGNDCFTSNTGTYEPIDEHHIRFRLKRVDVYGDCENRELYPDQDLGLYYLYPDSGFIRLIRSNGDPQADALNAFYSELIDQLDRATAPIYNLSHLQWKQSGSTEIPALVQKALTNQTEIKPADVEILLSKKIRSLFLVILIREHGKYLYVVADLSYQNVALFDPENPPE